MNIGDYVTPVTPAGLWLADCPVDGTFKQERENVCVFKGIGEILEQKDCVIDYDAWDEQDTDSNEKCDIGKVHYTNYLIRCSAGIGWAGQGAIYPAQFLTVKG